MGSLKAILTYQYSVPSPNDFSCQDWATEHTWLMAAWEALCLETLQFQLLDVCTACQDLMPCISLALQLCSFVVLS